jgi:hypothetical protein
MEVRDSQGDSFMKQLTLVLMISGITSFNAMAQKAVDYDFYYVDGLKIPLVEAKNLSAVRRTRDSEALINRLVDDEVAQEIIIPRLREKYRIILLEKK